MGSKYLCLDCGDVYDSSRININELFEYVYCPKTNCDGMLIEVDELLIPTIKVLNQKGYITKYCCSGHYDGQHSNSYIMFDDGITLPSLPKGFTMEEHDGRTVIRSARPFRQPTFGDFYKICDDAKTLLKWADKLPYLDE